MDIMIVVYVSWAYNYYYNELIELTYQDRECLRNTIKAYLLHSYTGQTKT